VSDFFVCSVCFLFLDADCSGRHRGGKRYGEFLGCALLMILGLVLVSLSDGYDCFFPVEPVVSSVLPPRHRLR
jgi:hypothetical protein